MTAADELLERIADTRVDRLRHRACGRGIEAMAAQLRENALTEALSIIEGRPIPPNTYHGPG